MADKTNRTIVILPALFIRIAFQPGPRHKINFPQLFVGQGQSQIGTGKFRYAAWEGIAYCCHGVFFTIDGNNWVGVVESKKPATDVFYYTGCSMAKF